MLTLSKVLKTTMFAALIGLAVRCRDAGQCARFRQSCGYHRDRIPAGAIATIAAAASVIAMIATIAAGAIATSAIALVLIQAIGIWRRARRKVRPSSFRFAAMAAQFNRAESAIV